MEKTVTIDGQKVRFRASAAVPRLYRMRYKRDILMDMQRIQNEMSKSKAKASSVTVEALTLFESIAHIMARHADPDNVPKEINDWLDGFGTFSIYQVFPVIQELWADNLKQLNKPQKK